MIARDEEEVVGRALRSVAWADEVVVVDGGSRDGTAAAAEELGARVVRAGEWPGFPEQRRRALEACAGPWILVLDADEEVSPELAAEIRETLAGEGGSAGGRTPAGAAGAPSGPAGLFAGYEIPFHTRYLGHWFGRRGWHRERHLRLARKDALRVTGGRVHEGLAVDGPAGRLRHPIRHYTYRSLEQHHRKMGEYARLKARELHERGRSATLASAVGHAAAALFTGYVLRGRFLDGWAGLVRELLSAQAALLAYLELRELDRRADDGPGSAPDEGGSAPDDGGSAP